MFPSKNLIYQFKSTLSLGLPLIAMTLTQSVIHLIDTIMVGWYGVTELAAAVLGTTFFFVFFIMPCMAAFFVIMNFYFRTFFGNFGYIRFYPFVFLYLVFLRM